MTVAPGERLTCMVSCEEPQYVASLVRLRHGDPDPAGPGVLEHPVPSAIDGTYPGTRQKLQPGSYGIVRRGVPLTDTAGFGLVVWALPTRLPSRRQVIVRAWHEQRGGFDLPGFVTLTAGLFALVLAMLRGNDWGWSSGRELGLLAAGVVFLGAFVLAERVAAAPMFDLSLFRMPTFTGAQIVAFAISSAMFSQFLYLTLYLQNVLGYSPIQAGLRFLPLSLLAFVAAPIAGRLSARAPVRVLLGVGMGLVGVALLLMHGVTPSSHWTTLLPGFVVGGIGIGMVNAPLASTAVSVVEPRRAGMASGINNTFRQVGIATGIAGLGALFQDKIRSELHGSPAAKAVASGVVQQGGHAARAAFISGLNEILVIGAVVAFAGALLGFALVRRTDFVTSGPPPVLEERGSGAQEARPHA